MRFFWQCLSPISPQIFQEGSKVSESVDPGAVQTEFAKNFLFGQLSSNWMAKAVISLKGKIKINSYI